MNIEAKARERRRRERQQAKRELKEARCAAKREGRVEGTSWESEPGAARQVEVNAFAQQLAEFIRGPQ